MYIGLQDLELRPVHFDVNIPPDQIHFDSKIKQSSDLHAKGSAQLLNRSLGEIRMQGELRVEIEGVCDRCAEPAKQAVENRFDLLYVPAEEAASGGEDEIDQAGTEVGYYEGNGIELNEVLREVVLLALPMQMVCMDECRGVCPVCGQNQNQGDCVCEPESADDRWSKLKALRAEIEPLK